MGKEPSSTKKRAKTLYAKPAFPPLISGEITPAQIDAVRRSTILRPKLSESLEDSITFFRAEADKKKNGCHTEYELSSTMIENITSVTIESLLTKPIISFNQAQVDLLADAALDTLGNNSVDSRLIRRCYEETDPGDSEGCKFTWFITGVRGAYIVCGPPESDDLGVYSTLKEAEMALRVLGVALKRIS
ncbi:hypothetical protein [Rhodoblastus sp.]|jgi:hypothetical protein|uniref:hypothetical protein n=1 Tax=Rhodoblastus sp. TaxID=1962975 RepID=UPI0026011D39|nr:hypothetical protein [Rhodoblastus sp.]